jgi:alpha/beta superfamily hydrolase
MVVLKPPHAQRLRIAGPAGELEALIETPAGEGEARDPVKAFGVVCHPHPLHGGTMDNKVVYTLARALEQLGAPAIRFNFRGVGASAGRYDEGRGETADALAIVAHGRHRWPGAELWLAGFSFGGAIAALAAHQARPTRLIAVAPGITLLPVAAVPECPWLIVQGEDDEVVPAQVVRRWAHTLSPPAELRLLAGAGHFFHGRLNDLREVVHGFMAGPAAQR